MDMSSVATPTSPVDPTWKLGTGGASIGFTRKRTVPGEAIGAGRCDCAQTEGDLPGSFRARARRGVLQPEYPPGAQRRSDRVIAKWRSECRSTAISRVCEAGVGPVCRAGNRLYGA